jgi:peptidoglycan biosynthesis protein MviN/MurJ (putative lipid II flippase)
MAHRAARRLIVSTAIVAAATGYPVLSLVREVISAYYFGAAGINAFTVAFQLPNLVRARRRHGSSSAFVPVFMTC